MRKVFKLLIILLIASTLESQVFAKDLGTWGAVYPIEEQDIKEFILKRLNTMQQNGELDKAKEQFISNVKKHTLRPKPVEGLTTTQEPKTFYYDPTFILDRDIKEANDKVIAAKGTRVNPLERVKLHGVMFFLDADDTRQIAWAKEQSKNYDYVKYILTKGNIKDAGDALDNKIYFDQYGKLSTKIGITHIPCIVTQDGLRLKIQEFKLKDEQVTKVTSKEEANEKS